MAAHPPGQLDQRAHGRRLDDGPVVIMVSPHFRYRTGQNDKQLILLRVGIQPAANLRPIKHGLSVLAVQGAIQLPFDS